MIFYNPFKPHIVYDEELDEYLIRRFAFIGWRILKQYYIVQHRIHFTGNKPYSLILDNKLTPYWGRKYYASINSYKKMNVELDIGAFGTLENAQDMLRKLCDKPVKKKMKGREFVIK